MVGLEELMSVNSVLAKIVRSLLIPKRASVIQARRELEQQNMIWPHSKQY